MKIIYDVYTLQNVDQQGAKRTFVKLKNQAAVSGDSLAQNIEHSCTLTQSDVKAVFSAIHSYALQEMQSGRRFHIPGLGYFSLSVALAKSEKDVSEKIRGTDICLRGINFRPEKLLLGEMGENLQFVRSKTSSQSVKYSQEALWQKVENYLNQNKFITNRAMRVSFGLTQYSASKWLNLFVGQNLLVKSGTSHSPIYFKK